MRAESGISTLAEDSNYSDYGLKFVLHVEPKEPKGAPYEADVAVQGTFRMHQMPDITDAKDLEKRALVNGVSLLYGLVRDMICTVTSRSVYGQMLLPTLNFASMASQAPEPTPLSAEAGTKGETKRRPGRKRVSA
jgi:preprotein translocase subunit SecB